MGTIPELEAEHTVVATPGDENEYESSVDNDDDMSSDDDPDANKMESEVSATVAHLIKACQTMRMNFSVPLIEYPLGGQ